MCISAAAAGLITAGVSAIGSYQSAKSDKAQLKAQRKAAEYNAQVAEQNARDAIFRGELRVQDVQRGAMQMRGAQRAGFAGNGVDVNFGTAADIQDETSFFGQIDAARERYNAANEALGYRQQGAQSSQQAAEYGKAASRINPLFNAATTFVGGAAPVAAKWYSNNRIPSASASATGSSSYGQSPYVSPAQRRISGLLGTG